MSDYTRPQKPLTMQMIRDAVREIKEHQQLPDIGLLNVLAQWKKGIEALGCDVDIQHVTLASNGINVWANVSPPPNAEKISLKLGCGPACLGGDCVFCFPGKDEE